MGDISQIVMNVVISWKQRSLQLSKVSKLWLSALRHQELGPLEFYRILAEDVYLTQPRVHVDVVLEHLPS